MVNNEKKKSINIDKKNKSQKKTQIKMKTNRIHFIIKKALKAHHHFGQSIIKNQKPCET